MRKMNPDWITTIQSDHIAAVIAKTVEDPSIVAARTAWREALERGEALFKNDTLANEGKSCSSCHSMPEQFEKIEDSYPRWTRISSGSPASTRPSRSCFARRSAPSWPPTTSGFTTCSSTSRPADLPLAEPAGCRPAGRARERCRLGTTVLSPRDGVAGGRDGGGEDHPPADVHHGHRDRPALERREVRQVVRRVRDQAEERPRGEYLVCSLALPALPAKPTPATGTRLRSSVPPLRSDACGFASRSQGRRTRECSRSRRRTRISWHTPDSAQAGRRP